MWCKTHVLPLQSQHVTSSYHIFKNKYNYTQSIIILIYKFNQLGVYWDVIRCGKMYWILRKMSMCNILLDGVKHGFYTPFLLNSDSFKLYISSKSIIKFKIAQGKH